MKWQKIVSHDGLNDFTAPSTIGGRFNVSMIGSDKDSKLRNAMYLAEIGPSQCDKVCQGHMAGQWFSLGTLVSSTNNTGCHDIT
jgi:hypothetical protein